MTNQQFNTLIQALYEVAKAALLAPYAQQSPVAEINATMTEMQAKFASLFIPEVEAKKKGRK